MSTAMQQTGSSKAASAPADPFLYGWRDVPTTRPDGTVDFVRVPLTLEDVLHPEYGDVIPVSTLHDLVRTYLSSVFRARTHHDPNALVISDVFVYWDDPELKHHGPDIAAIFGVRDRDAYRRSFFVAEEGVRPRLIVEVVSPDTRVNDVETKFVQYHLARVPIYVVLDRKKDNDPWELHGYQNTPGGYRERPRDEHGRLWLEDIGVWLGVDGQKVICYDPVTGEPIGDYTEVTRLFETEKARAETEKARAETEKARAEAEIQARQAAETRLRELEAELARLRGQPPSP
jgi:colicin import membrane protein